MSVKPIPEGFHTVTPYLIVKDVPRLIDFLKQAFDAAEIHRSVMPDGTVNHATVKIGDSMVMMGQSQADYPPMPCMLYLYVPDVDATFQKALAAGGTTVREVRDESYGDRAGGLRDFADNQWWVATHVDDAPLG